MFLPGKKGKLFKRRKVRLLSQTHPFSTTALSQLLRKSGFFRTAGKHQVNTETGGALQRPKFTAPPTISQPTPNYQPVFIPTTELSSTGYKPLSITTCLLPTTTFSLPAAWEEPHKFLSTTSNGGSYKTPNPAHITESNLVKVPLRRISSRTNHRNMSQTSPTMMKAIPTRISARRIKSYEKIPTRSINRCNLIPLCNTREKRPNSSLPPILLTNVRSLLSKVDELDVIALLTSAHVISVTETWLTNAVPDRAVNIPNFILMRKDRSHCSKSIGGGICAYVHHSIPAERLTNFQLPGFESLWIHLKSYRLPRHTSTILLGVIYHPPSAKAENNELLIEHVNSNVDSLLNKYPDALIVLTGDFNPNSTNISLSTLARSCGLTQLVKVPARGNNILDWCLVNKPKLFDEPVQLPNIGSSDHFSILINPSAPNPVIRERHVYKREMKDGNVRAFGRWICNDPWRSVLLRTIAKINLISFMNQ